MQVETKIFHSDAHAEPELSKVVVQGALRSSLPATRSRRARRIALVLDTASPFHRSVMSGIGAFVRASELGWRMVVDKRLPESPEGFDGFIVDIDAQGVDETHECFAGRPVIFVGAAASHGPAHAQPRVCADNAAMVELAISHLRDIGAAHSAFFSRSRYRDQAWARERIDAFRNQIAEPVGVWEGANDVSDEEAQALAWLRALPPRTGIVAVNDSSARELLHLCAQIGRSVPQDIAVVGIDNDPLVAALSPLLISSVMQANEEIGRKAADLLRRRFSRAREVPAPVLLVPPAGLQPAATSSKASGLVRGAMEFMEQQAGRGIKAQQVADHLGVSRSTLERTFLAHLGVTVHDELLRLRIARAKRMLAARECSTAEVAQRCGFRTQQYMHVVFKRELGISPAEFANSVRAGTDAIEG